MGERVGVGQHRPRGGLLAGHHAHGGLGAREHGDVGAADLDAVDEKPQVRARERVVLAEQQGAQALVEGLHARARVQARGWLAASGGRQLHVRDVLAQSLGEDDIRFALFVAPPVVVELTAAMANPGRRCNRLVVSSTIPRSHDPTIPRSHDPTIPDERIAADRVLRTAGSIDERVLHAELAALARG